jgi:hypothetical protein
VAKRKRTYADTTVPPIGGTFEQGLMALLAAGPAPKNLGKKSKRKSKRTKKRTG